MPKDFQIPKVDPLSGPASVADLAKFAGLSERNIVIVNGKTPFDGNDNLKLNYDRDAPLGKSSLGTNIYSDLTLKYIQPYSEGTNGSLIEAVKEDIYLETVLITLDQSIDIVKTQIQGRRGRVKEYIGADDAKIVITGSITSKNGVYPRDAVGNLKRWLDAPVSKQVTAWWLEMLDIYNIVIDSYSIPQAAGQYSQQFFTINASGDLPVELEIIQPIT